MGAPPGPRRVNQAASATAPPRPRDTGRAGVRALESPAHVRVPAAGARRGNSDARARHEHILLPADPDAHPVTGQPYEFLAPANGFTSRLDLQPGFGGEVPALGYERGDRLPRVSNPPPPTRLARRLPPGRIAPGPRSISQVAQDAPLDARSVARQLAPPRARRSTDG